MRPERWLIGLLLLAVGCAARAELRIEITQGAAQVIPIAVVPYGNDGGADAIHAVIGADLTRSGQFRVVPDEQILSRPTEAAQVNFRDFQLVMAQYLAIGRLLPCNVIVYAGDEPSTSVVAVLDPEVQLGVTGRTDITPLATEVKAKLVRALNAVKAKEAQ